MADVLLTHSYHLPYDRKQVRKMQPYPPLGTLYAAAVLRQHQGSPSRCLTRCCRIRRQDSSKRLQRHRPEIVAIYEDDFNFLTKMCLTRMREVALQMIDDARQSWRAGDRPRIGRDRPRPAIICAQGFEFVLLGEAEQTLLQCRPRDSAMARDASQIPGVAYLRRSDSEDIGEKHARRPLMRSSSGHLPFPARDLIDMKPYREAWMAAHGYVFAEFDRQPRLPVSVQLVREADLWRFAFTRGPRMKSPRKFAI